MLRRARALRTTGATSWWADRVSLGLSGFVSRCLRKARWAREFAPVKSILPMQCATGYMYLCYLNGNVWAQTCVRSFLSFSIISCVDAVPRALM
eukprot:3628566-Prymnesium_polylepis.1